MLPFRTFFTRLFHLNDLMKWDREIDKHFGKVFNDFESIEKMEPPQIKDDKNTYYKMTIRTDHNGQAKVKSMEKAPGEDWKVQCDEFKREDEPAFESQKQKEQQKLEAKEKAK